MCTNLDSLLHLIGILEGYQQSATAAVVPWKKRLDSVNALIGGGQVIYRPHYVIQLEFSNAVNNCVQQ